MDLREQFEPLASQRGFVAGEAGDVPTRAVEPRDDAADDGIDHARKYDRDRSRLPLDGKGRHGPPRQNDVGLQADQLLRKRSHPIDVIPAPAKVPPHVAAIGPTQARKRWRERGDAKLPHGIVFAARHKHADAPHAVALLRVRFRENEIARGVRAVAKAGATVKRVIIGAEGTVTIECGEDAEPQRSTTVNQWDRDLYGKDKASVR
jgi:hypothetical protein